MKSQEINKAEIFASIDKLISTPNFSLILGQTWYQDNKARIFKNVVLKAPLKGLISLKVYLAVVAILSPANSWNSNQWDANILVLRFFGIDSEKGYKYRTYQTNVLKAELLLKRIYLQGWGETHAIETSLNISTSLKTCNFYNNLLDPQNNNFVTIDRHILKIMGFNVKQITPKNYEILKNIFIEYWTVRKFNFSVSSLQAILWVNYLVIQEKKVELEAGF
jgi:hypothetical protein